MDVFDRIKGIFGQGKSRNIKIKDSNVSDHIYFFLLQLDKRQKVTNLPFEEITTDEEKNILESITELELKF